MQKDSKQALVVGAYSGFGKDVAKRLFDLGFTVYASARRTELMDDLKERGACGALDRNRLVRWMLCRTGTMPNLSLWPYVVSSRCGD